MRQLFAGGLFSLVLAYSLSQFYRAFLAVMTPVLHQQIGAGPEDLALSSGLWYIGFAATQLPVGWALDRFGPRLTVAAFMTFGAAVGAAIFALAQQPWHLHVAMTMLGIGCAPIMMGSFYIFARTLPPAAFSAAGGAVVGIGSLGNIMGAAPLVWTIDAIGWRPTLWGMCAITLMVVAAIMILVKDPKSTEADQPRGTLSELVRLRPLRLILPLLLVTYAASACIRGLWAGPYLAEVFGASDGLIGWVTLGMGLAMVGANLSAGRLVKTLRSDRAAVMAVNCLLVCVLAALALLPGLSLGLSATLLVAICLSDSSYSLIMAHGRAFLPNHLLGRGITFLNMIAITGVGIMQFASRPVYIAASEAHTSAAAYGRLFLFFLIPQAIGLFFYLFSPRDKHV